MAKMTPPLGIKGYVVRVTKKKLKELVEGKKDHWIHMSSPAFFMEDTGTYRCHKDERFDGVTYEEAWKLIKQYGITNARICYQDVA